jgi:hypothetical protein
MNELIDLGHLVEELRSTAGLDAHAFDGQVIITLPCSYDQLILSPGRSTASPKIFWQQRTSIGGATGKSGFLDWPSQSRPLIDFAIYYAYSLDEYGPQYRAVLEALRGRGLDAQLQPADGGGYLIRIPLHADGYLLIGAGEALPPRLEQVTGWHVQHHIDGDVQAVVYDSMPENRGRGGLIGGPDINRMADSVARYVSELLVRYGGPSPLGAPRRGETSPGTLAWLLQELVALPPHLGQATTDGGALITIAAQDGSGAVTVAVPPVVVNRISAMVLAEITASQAIGR